MRLQLEKLGKIVHIDDDKGYAVAIVLALIIVSSVVAGYYLVLRPQPEAYNTIYLLDTQKKAINYPEVLVANQNSTFKVYVGVVNHMGEGTDYQIQVKIAQNVSTFPVDIQPSHVYNTGNVANGAGWETLATVTQNQLGTYTVVFELWQQNKQTGTYEFKGNDYCALNIQVTN